MYSYAMTLEKENEQILTTDAGKSLKDPVCEIQGARFTEYGRDEISYSKLCFH